MSIDDIVIYYYIVKTADYVKVTEDYEKLYNDVVKHIPQLPKESQHYLYEYVKQNLSGCDNHWTKLTIDHIEKEEGRS